MEALCCWCDDPNAECGNLLTGGNSILVPSGVSCVRARYHLWLICCTYSLHVSRPIKYLSSEFQNYLRLHAALFGVLFAWTTTPRLSPVEFGGVIPSELRSLTPHVRQRFFVYTGFALSPTMTDFHLARFREPRTLFIRGSFIGLGQWLGVDRIWSLNRLMVYCRWFDLGNRLHSR